MSGEPIEPTCQAIVAEFVWGGPRCDEPAPHKVWFDGQEWDVCDEHWEQA